MTAAVTSRDRWQWREDATSMNGEDDEEGLINEEAEFSSTTATKEEDRRRNNNDNRYSSSSSQYSRKRPRSLSPGSNKIIFSSGRQQSQHQGSKSEPFLRATDAMQKLRENERHTSTVPLNNTREDRNNHRSMCNTPRNMPFRGGEGPARGEWSYNTNNGRRENQWRSNNSSGDKGEQYPNKRLDFHQRGNINSRACYDQQKDSRGAQQGRSWRDQKYDGGYLKDDRRHNSMQTNGRDDYSPSPRYDNKKNSYSNNYNKNTNNRNTGNRFDRHSNNSNNRRFEDQSRNNTNIQRYMGPTPATAERDSYRNDDRHATSRFKTTSNYHSQPSPDNRYDQKPSFPSSHQYRTNNNYPREEPNRYTRDNGDFKFRNALRDDSRNFDRSYSGDLNKQSPRNDDRNFDRNFERSYSGDRNRLSPRSNDRNFDRSYSKDPKSYQHSPRNDNRSYSNDLNKSYSERQSSFAESQTKEGHQFPQESIPENYTMGQQRFQQTNILPQRPPQDQNRSPPKKRWRFGDDTTSLSLDQQKQDLNPNTTPVTSSYGHWSPSKSSGFENRHYGAVAQQQEQQPRMADPRTQERPVQLTKTFLPRESTLPSKQAYPFSHNSNMQERSPNTSRERNYPAKQKTFIRPQSVSKKSIKAESIVRKVVEPASKKTAHRPEETNAAVKKAGVGIPSRWLKPVAKAKTPTKQKEPPIKRKNEQTRRKEEEKKAVCPASPNLNNRLVTDSEGGSTLSNNRDLLIAGVEMSRKQNVPTAIVTKPAESSPKVDNTEDDISKSDIDSSVEDCRAGPVAAMHGEDDSSSSDDSSCKDDSDTDDEEVMMWASKMFGVPFRSPTKMEKTSNVEAIEKPSPSKSPKLRLKIPRPQVEREKPNLDLSSLKKIVEKKKRKRILENEATVDKVVVVKKKRGRPKKKKVFEFVDQPFLTEEKDQIETEDEKMRKESAKPLTAEQIQAILGDDDYNSSGGANWVRRSVRQPSKDLLNAKSVKMLVAKLKNNDPDMVMLKMKKYINDPNAPQVVLDAALDALEENTSCECLYIQNFNLGMQDAQVLHLLKILQQPKCKIWCLNIGENYNVKTKTWDKFTKGLRKTKVTHMYASEHTITTEMKDKIRATIRKNRKKHDMHINPKNLHVIIQCTHCWWNPINAKELRPYLRREGLETILDDREAQGLRGSTSAAPTG